MPTVRGGDPGESERLGEGDDRGIHEPEPQSVETSIQVRDASVSFPWQICDQVVPVQDPRVEGEAAFRPQPLAEEVIYLWNDWCGNNQPALLPLDERARTLVPPIA